jgi:hypothetical protein
MRRHRTGSSVPRNNRGALLSLFAMLMIFLGPLVSQSMPMEQHGGMATSVSAATDHGAASGEHAHHRSEHAVPARAADSGMADHALWAKCGYCTLLFSCPALPQVLALVAADPPRPADFYVALAQQGHARQSIFPNARSRAPPRLLTV